MSTTPQPQATVTFEPAPQPPPAPVKPRVALLFGGRSGEHPISVVTAAGVMSAIDHAKYQVLPIGITRQGQWVLADPVTLHQEQGDMPEVVAADDSEVLLSMIAGNRSVRRIRAGKPPEELGQIDVAFPVLHGPYGEDGTIQGLLDLAGVPYVGPGVLASAVGMDKHYMKVAFEAAGMHVAPYLVVYQRDWARDPAEITARVAELTLPLFVKPARAGSSLGITRLDSLDQLPAAMAEAQRHDPKVIVEHGIPGREIECAVLGGRAGGSPRASLPGEIVLKDGGWYSFDAKYLGDGEVELACPADLPPEVTEAVRAEAVLAFEAIDGEGLSRADVFVTPDNEVIVNEINTMPGFTPISMFPRMWAATGLAYPDLIDELIQLALERTTGLR